MWDTEFWGESGVSCSQPRSGCRTDSAASPAQAGPGRSLGPSSGLGSPPRRAAGSDSHSLRSDSGSRSPGCSWEGGSSSRDRAPSSWGGSAGREVSAFTTSPGKEFHRLNAEESRPHFAPDRPIFQETGKRNGCGVAQGKKSSETMTAWAHNQWLQNFWMRKSTFLHLCAKLTKIKAALTMEKKKNCTMGICNNRFLLVNQWSLS
ncbi:uncharacterized protein LOC128823113 [Malaclemys terrapin pileata]|uniref:uncharacterized protein LOC128823113 n=1 Tax=Malaclemys terrapin pileata TaxID=2991368 RepID=UPI0023A7CA21|nr:uncharacterized protein LOC128823113 [Malaclemys terrapin pileata]